MKSIFSLLFRLAFLIVLVGGVTAYVDYNRLVNGDAPIFCKTIYYPTREVQTYNGLFYTASRKYRGSVYEGIYESDNIRFGILNFYFIDIPRNYRKENLKYKLNIKKSDSCSASKLIYANLDFKVYTYCLDEFNILEDNKNTSFESVKDSTYTLEYIKDRLSYKGKYRNDSVLLYINYYHDLTDFGIKLYQCSNDDYYFLPEEEDFQGDFCTFKDDDFKFIYSIVEDPHDEVKETEVFYEDETYRYEFDSVRKNYIYIYAPAVRGKGEVRIPLMDVINQGILTIDELANKGLKFNKINKAEEAKNMENNNGDNNITPSE